VELRCGVAPIRVGGSLAKPTIGINPEKALLQAGTGTVLAALLTPIAAILAFIDPGLAKDADCSALVAQAAPGGADVQTSTTGPK
jgi:hypothetical protein